jgi:hypothetical protein
VRLPLNESAVTTLAGAVDTATGRARIGPTRAGVRWDIRTISITSSSTVAIPQAELFLGEPGAASFKDGTYTGSRNSTNIEITLYSGQYFTVVWTFGDPGATANVTVTGDNVIGEG